LFHINKLLEYLKKRTVQIVHMLNLSDMVLNVSYLRCVRSVSYQTIFCIQWRPLCHIACTNSSAFMLLPSDRKLQKISERFPYSYFFFSL